MNADQILDLEKAPKKLAARQYTRLSGHCRNVSAKFLKGAAKRKGSTNHMLPAVI